jgi:hypothetical protein
MIEAARCPGLALKAFECRGIRGELRRQKFQRDRTAQLEIFSVVHHTHAARAQHANDAVMEDGAPDHGSVGILGNVTGVVNERC